MIDFMKEAKELEDTLVYWRRDIHKHAEPSREEFRTADLAAKHLESLGMEVRRDFAGDLPSTVGLLRGRQPGPTVALRADMDALRMQEENDVDYRSINDGVMHACGHDGHTAILMGVAQMLAGHLEEMKGNVKFIFEPAEEDIGGGQFMVRNGVLENPKVDAIFAPHVLNDYQVGQICICHGEMKAASDRLIIKIFGKAAHGATPHKGIDAIMLSSHFLVALQTMMAREKDAFSHATINIGQINGGTARNAVCDEVVLHGIVRSLNNETREMLNRRIDELLKGITLALGGSYELERQKSVEPLYNTPELSDHIRDTALVWLKPEDIKVMPHAELGCETFSYFTQEVPGAMYWLGSGNAEKGINTALHTRNFNLDEQCLVIGTAMGAALAWNYLEKHA